MDVGMLEQMFKLMAAHDVNAVDVREGERRVIIKRGPTAGATAPVAYAAPPTAAPVSHAAPTTPPATPAANPDAGLVPIKSPMVGTFYAASSPDAKPFVTVGSTVNEETDVCVVEAMKVFNNIKAETRGTIAKVVVTNGQTVEFGQVLFLVKP
jgi:acetyl-CoA carboxylase biotin carboxyl carrier protein